VVIYNTQTEAVVKEWEVTDYPVRSAKFIARKQQVIVGSDDIHLRVYNYNTSELVKNWEAHTDYIRSLAVHPTLPYVLSAADDMTIKLWDWEKGWSHVRTFEGHEHYVMAVTFNPKDPNTFASASLDRSIKVWSLTSTRPNYTLEGPEGHEKGVNCISYYLGGDKPYLISGSDDKLVKIWDYQTKSCIQTLQGHQQYISSVAYHPELPLFFSSSEDGSVRIYNSNTYSLVKTLNYGMDRCWSICTKAGSNKVALGFDEGTVIIKMGREAPAASMDSSGKILYAIHSAILTTQVKADADMPDGELLQLPRKEMGTSELYPQSIKHSPNGRLCAVLGDGEYVIYMALAWRNKAFGDAAEFVWGRGKGQYAIRERVMDPKIKLFNDFKETVVIRPDFTYEGIHGDGPLLAVRGKETLAFYDWDRGSFVTQIDGVQAKDLFWSPNGNQLIISTETSFFRLKYNTELVASFFDNTSLEIPEEGIEEAFTDAEEIQDRVRTGVWARDCFLYTNANNKLNYCVGSLIETTSHLDRSLYLLGYLPKYNKIYLMDKSHAVLSYSLDLSVIEYQTAVLRKDFGAAQEIFPRIPEKDRTRVAHFLEANGHHKQALNVTTDPDHKFELAIFLGELKIAHDIAENDKDDAVHKWRQISELALTKWQFKLAEKAMWRANDFSGLLVLYSSLADAKGISQLAVRSVEEGRYNIGFTCLFLLGRANACLDLLIKAGRVPEACFMARSYVPSRLTELVALWREELGKTNPKIAQSLADPTQFPNLFHNFEESLDAEKRFYGNPEIALEDLPDAIRYPELASQLDRNLIEELKTLATESLEETTSAPAIASVTSDEEPKQEQAQEPENKQEKVESLGSDHAKSSAEGADGSEEGGESDASSKKEQGGESEEIKG